MDRNFVWHVVNEDQTTTEIRDEVLRTRILDGSVRQETLLWRPGMSDWQPASAISGLFFPPERPHVERSVADLLQKGSEFAVQEDLSSGSEARWPPKSGLPTGQPNAGPSAQQETKRQPACRDNYIIRHWRGDLPLAVSYWLNGLLLTVAITVASAILQLWDIADAPRLISASFATLTLFAIAGSVWQLVGIWRSANRAIDAHGSKRESAFWAQAAKIATVIGWLSLVGNMVSHNVPSAMAYLQIAFGVDPTPHHALRVVGNGKEIELSGGIDFGTNVDLLTLLNASPDVRTIDLNSAGGRVAEAEQIRKTIRERGLATYTTTLCASACTIVYMGGTQRFLGPGGKLAFHRYAFPGFTDEQETQANSKRGGQSRSCWGN